MKGIAILVAVLLGSAAIASAQVHDPVFSYRFCKNRYNTAGFALSPTDPYVPFYAGALAYVFPGLGHVYDGEILRGLAFLAGTYCSIGVGAVLLQPQHFTEEHYDPQYGYYEETVVRSPDSSLGGILVLGGVALWIWNICDAVRVAKVKDLYYRDLSGRWSSLDATVQPTLDFAPVTGKPTAGLSLRVSF